MKPLLLARQADGKAFHLTDEMCERSHSHVIGGSRTGKSKFLEFWIREWIRLRHRCGLLVLDWHGSLYDDIVGWLAYHDIGLKGDSRKVILIDPSQPDFVTPFNPFFNRGGEDAFVSTLVNRRIEAMIRPWGQTNTNETPLLERNCRPFYTYLIEAGETLGTSAKLLDFQNHALRQRAIETVSDDHIKSQFQEWQSIKSEKEWRDTFLSLKNRLDRFLADKGVKRFMGLPEAGIDLMEAMDRGYIVLVNLGHSDYLDRTSARIFASLFLYELFEAAMRRVKNARKTGKKPKLFMAFLDEFQNFVTDDLAAMLDQVLKGGLHLAMAHQHMGQLGDNPHLEESIFVNARLRFVFGGETYPGSCKLGNEMFLPDLNSRQIKKAYYHTIHLYREETRTATSRTSGSGWSKSTGQSSGHSTGRSSTISSGTSLTAGIGTSMGSSTGLPTTPTFFGQEVNQDVEGWFTQNDSSSESSSQTTSESRSEAESESSSYAESQSEGESGFESEGETTFPVWVPIPVQELASETEWSREEKLSKIAEMLKCQQQRHCFAKLDTEKTQPLMVPYVKTHFIEPRAENAYKRAIYKRQKARPGKEVDLLIAENERAFLNPRNLPRLKIASLSSRRHPAPDEQETVEAGPKPLKKQLAVASESAELAETRNDDFWE